MLWWVHTKVPRSTDRSAAANWTGNLMIAFILGWLCWPVIVLVMAFGPIRQWKVWTEWLP